jgi:hypothetical protein
VVIFLLFIINSCKESPNEYDDISVSIVSDSILFTDVIPDIALNYTFDTMVDDFGNEKIRGEFNYQLDLNQDSIIDFKITGRKWPGFLKENGQWIYFDTTYIVSINPGAYIGYRPPSTCYFCPCNAQSMITDEIIDKNLTYGWIQKVSINYDSNEGGCFWDSRSGANNFLAVRLRVNLETYYGWIDIDGAINPVVKEYAINLRNEKSIRAGQKK